MKKFWTLLFQLTPFMHFLNASKRFSNVNTSSYVLYLMSAIFSPFETGYSGWL